jgi:hypothetical protein
MTQFLLLFRGGEGVDANLSPEQMQAHMQKWAKWMGDLTEQGKMLGAQPLMQHGKTLRGTKKVLTDGPFMEGKEMIGGYLLCEADSYDAALEIAKGCPLLESEDGIVEVREVRELNM